MNLIKNKKIRYLLMLGIICLLPMVLSPTYAKFISSYVTDNDVVEMDLSFNVGITGIDEYHEIEVASGESLKFNVEVENASDITTYYGVWYKMIVPSELPDDESIQIGRLGGTTGTTSGEITGGGSTEVSFGIINSTSSKVVVYIGVASSTTGINDIEYLNGKNLITGEVDILKDINITSITIDGTKTDSLPTSGIYTMDYTCSMGSTLRWDTFTKSIIYEKGSKVGDKCSVTFTSSTDYVYLNTMSVGSYVAYVGSGGTVGSTSVSCQTNGSASSSTETDETEAPHSCLGQNAREDIDENGNTYGYCYSEDYKYYTTGWRIAYIDSNNKAVIVSGGSPECNKRTSSTANATYIKTANSLALKYCNPDYVDGDCSCLDSDSDGYCDCTDSDSDGLCDEIENGAVDAWAISDLDFYNMTKAISGVGKRLVSESSSLGDSGGTLGTTLYCYGYYSREECGYNNDLIDNGGYYWFAAQYFSSDTYGVYWRPITRYVSYSSDAYAYGLRPVISLSSSVYVTGESGTMDDPYTIANS